MTDQPGGAGGAAGSSPATSAASRRDVATLARGAALNVVGIVVNAVFAFAFGVIVARALGAEGSGTFFVAIAAFTILQVVAQFGADTGAIRTIARYEALGRVGDIRTVVRVGMVPVLVQGTVLAVVLYAAAGGLASALIRGPSADVETYLRVLAPFLPLAAGMAVALAAARGLGAMLPFVVVERIGSRAGCGGRGPAADLDRAHRRRVCRGNRVAADPRVPRRASLGGIRRGTELAPRRRP
jgi:O-antigen/teichoic acid export membrane protein